MRSRTRNYFHVRSRQQHANNNRGVVRGPNNVQVCTSTKRRRHYLKEKKWVAGWGRHKNTKHDGHTYTGHGHVSAYLTVRLTRQAFSCRAATAEECQRLELDRPYLKFRGASSSSSSRLSVLRTQKTLKPPHQTYTPGGGQVWSETPQASFKKNNNEPTVSINCAQTNSSYQFGLSTRSFIRHFIRSAGRWSVRLTIFSLQDVGVVGPSAPRPQHQHPHAARGPGLHGAVQVGDRHAAVHVELPGEKRLRRWF